MLISLGDRCSFKYRVLLLRPVPWNLAESQQAFSSEVQGAKWLGAHILDVSI